MTPLLLTASIDTRGMKGAMFAAEERERMYVDTLNFYIREFERRGIHGQIVFAENSGWRKEYVLQKLKPSKYVEVEYIALATEGFIQEKGKSYNELLMMDRAIAQSTFIEKAGCFFKLTGRFPILNALDLVEEAERWGPDNCAAYLKKHGTFGASVLFLVCSSHDAYDVMTFGPVVGMYNNYPDKQYKLGLWELFDRYLILYLRTRTGAFTLTKTKTKTKTGTYVDPDAQVEKKAANREVVQKGYLFNPGFDQLKLIADSCHFPMVVYLHAEQGELADGDYNDMGQDIIHWCDTAGVQLIRGIDTEKPEMYHDAIHFNEKGQRHLAFQMEKTIKIEVWNICLP